MAILIALPLDLIIKEFYYILKLWEAPLPVVGRLSPELSHSSSSSGAKKANLCPSSPPSPSPSPWRQQFPLKKSERYKHCHFLFFMLFHVMALLLYFQMTPSLPPSSLFQATNLTQPMGERSGLGRHSRRCWYW